MYSSLKINLARLFRAWAAKLAPNTQWPEQMQLPIGTLRREKVKALNTYPPQKWEALVKYHGDALNKVLVCHDLTLALGKSIALELEKRGAVEFNFVYSGDGVISSAKTYIYIKHD